ncbi:hypothetical protein ACRS8K_17520 [Serratia marcescens]
MSAVLTTAAVPAEDTRVSRREWCAILGGLIGGFMAILDIQIANSSMKVIQGALSATLNDSSWLMTSYFTAEIVAIPLCGWLCQALGRALCAVVHCRLFGGIAAVFCRMESEFHDRV